LTPAFVATDGVARGGVAERWTTQHVNERLETASALLTGYFTLLQNQQCVTACWSHVIDCSC